MRHHYFAGAALVALLSPVAAYAQETTSSIRGTVTSGATPIAGAEITITHVPSGTTSSATSGADGSFSANGLRIGGPYTVKVSAPGYSDTTITDIQTIASQPFQLPIALAAEGGDEIVVTASRVQGAGTVSQGPATVLSANQIANIATVNRDIRDLQRRDPFARLDDTPTGGRAVSFAGQNARYNRFSVDGVAITDNFGLNTDGLPSRRSPIPLDAIGQFQAKVAPYDVREGNFQGGAINIVLRSGTNDFQGTGFYAYSADELVGKTTKPGPGIPNGRALVPNFKIQNYGAEISGPIIKDKLFFMVAGERLRGGRPIAEGPTDNNAGTAIPNLTQAIVDRVSSIAQSVYNYDTGGVQRSLGDKDDRLVAKIDANLSDSQRLSLTYTYAKDGITLLNNTFSSITTGSPGLGLASNAYTQGNRLHTGVVQLNSEWSDDFSTEVRGFYKNYKRIQDPLLGRGFAQFRVCTNAVSVGTLTGCENTDANGTPIPANSGTAAVVSFGPDNSRQTNALNSESFGGLVQARLTRNGHDVRAFAEYTDTKIFNAFLQNSAGNYYFDSIADFQNRRANSLSYANAIPSLNPDDSAARFGYQLYTFGIMDTVEAADGLNVSFGARYDLFGGHDRPALSAAFSNRYANGAIVDGVRTKPLTNIANLQGRGLFQPRFGFDWKPLPHLTIRGGGGIFGGGAPDVYLSNSFSNTGVLTNTISTNRNTSTNGCTTLTSAAACTAALNGVTGTSIPTAVNQQLLNATVASNATVNALDPNFKIPSQWRATLSAEYNGDLGPLGSGWTFGADVLFSSVRNQVYFTDIRSVPVTVAANALTPDGRQRYQNLIDGPTSTNTNTDILLTNTKQGRAYIGVLRFEKAWDFGLNLNGSFTYQDVKDRAPATSSTAGSNYSNGAFVDPNNVAYGTSNDEVRYFFKYGASFDHAFFGDYKTTIALFGETRIGHPFSYTFQDFGSNRSAVFGVTGRSSATSTAGNRYLLYVPTGLSDPKVQFSDPAFAQAFDNFINSSGLSKYRGRVAPRNGFNSKWFTRLDLHLSQELPVPAWDKARVTLFADVENFTNLINKKWGQQREYVFPYNAAVAQVQCLTTAGNVTPVAGAPTGTVAANTSQACAQYRYSPLGGTTAFTTPTDQVYVNQSLYAVRVGIRFGF